MTEHERGGRRKQPRVSCSLNDTLKICTFQEMKFLLIIGMVQCLEVKYLMSLSYCEIRWIDRSLDGLMCDKAYIAQIEQDLVL